MVAIVEVIVIHLAWISLARGQKYKKPLHKYWRKIGVEQWNDLKRLTFNSN